MTRASRPCLRPRSLAPPWSALRIGGDFALVYLVFNTIMNLTTQDEQVACFTNAARHLRPGGRFVIENGVPRLRQLPPGTPGVPFALSEDRVSIDDFPDLPR